MYAFIIPRTKNLNELSSHNLDPEFTNMLYYNEEMYQAIFRTHAKHSQIVASIDNLNEPNLKNQNINQTLEFVRQVQKIAKDNENYGKREVHVHSVISRENFQNIIKHIDKQPPLSLRYKCFS